jgi:hypothetical protein
MRNAIIAAVFAVALIPVSGHAALRAVQPLPGYACMMTRLSPAQMRDFGALPRIVDRPSPSGKPIALASAIVFVRSPQHLQNGYAHLMPKTGQTGSLQRDWLQPYHSASDPRAHCTPSLMSNGKPGIG